MAVSIQCAALRASHALARRAVQGSSSGTRFAIASRRAIPSDGLASAIGLIGGMSPPKRPRSTWDRW
jgi:hypothetical protein